MTGGTKTASPWGPVRLDAGQSLKGTFGPLQLWLLREETDWFCASRYTDAPTPQLTVDHPASLPDDAEWIRLGCETDHRILALAPSLPDRAVVVRPEMPFTILPGERIRFFVRIPLWVQISTAYPTPLVWCDLPTRILSKTWFGTVEQGEPAYALRTTATRSLDTMSRDADRIICPVRLKNQSSDVLRLDRICLRVQHLEVYEGTTSLWTNQAGVTYRGDNESNRVVYGRGAPPFDHADAKIASAREPSRGAFLLQAITSGNLFT